LHSSRIVLISKALCAVSDDARIRVCWRDRVADDVSKDDAARQRAVAQVGAEVFGVARFYSYAEYVVVPWRQLFPRVPSWSPVQLAGFPAVFLTALYAIRHCARVEPGARVLVHSASGGVGLALCQLLRTLNCSVIVGVVGRSHKVAAARLAGATHVIDKSLAGSELWSQIERVAPNFDAVFDANGVETLRNSFEHVAPGGTLVVYGFHTMLPTTGGDVNIWSAPLAFLRLAWNWLRSPTIDPMVLTTANRTVSGFNLSYLFDKIDLFESYMQDMVALMHAGKLTPPPVQEFDLADVGSAHRALESAQTVGKMVLVTEFGRSLQKK
jgi:NADPH:quinone reductase-like Zn-dependent oxidoreductase